MKEPPTTCHPGLDPGSRALPTGCRGETGMTTPKAFPLSLCGLCGKKKGNRKLKMSKRNRLSTKQIVFFKNVFLAGRTVNESLGDLNIRLSTFDRWLTKPLFLRRLQMHINHYYIETRMELARNAPQAVSGLNFLSEKSLRHKEVRQACNDLLNLHSQYTNPEPSKSEGQKKAKNGEVLDNFGVFLEQFGVILDNNRVIKDKLGNTKSPKNNVFNTNNAENTKFPRLIP
jgi:hypothetical protein